MEFHCSACGYRSDDAGFFRRRGRGARLCEGCGEQQPSERWGPTFVLIASLLLVYVPMLISLADEAGRAAVILMVVAWSCGWPLTIAVHEFGHALAARWAGLEVSKVVLGAGRLWFRRRWLGVPVEVRRNPLAGGRTHFVDLRHRLSRWPAFWAVCGGPGANLCAAAVLVASAYLVSRLGRSIWIDLLVAVLSGLAGNQAIMAASNLIPFGKGDLADGVKKDGLLLLILLFAPRPQVPDKVGKLLETRRYLQVRRFAEAEAASFEAIRLDPASAFALSNHLHCISRNRGPAAALRYYIDNKPAFDAVEAGGKNAEGDVLGLLHANVAWLALCADGPPMADLAARHARQAFEASPDSPASKAVYGAALSRGGDAEKGAKLLIEALRGLDDPLDKADTCALLAALEQERGDRRRAESFTGLQRRLIAGAAA